ncbi:pilus assembly protein CpaE [Sphingomonas sp. ASV193]
MNPSEAPIGWTHRGPLPAVRLFLGQPGGEAAALVGRDIGGFEVELVPVNPSDAIDASRLVGAGAALVEVDVADPASFARFEALAKAKGVALVAAAYDPPLALVRALVRAGAHDVIPLPLDAHELETALRPIAQQIAASRTDTHLRRGKLVSVIKAVGGVGATAIAGQLALRFAARERAHGRGACLIDFDVQFGDAAFQLGLSPALSLGDLVKAGKRLDGELLRSTVTQHPSGLKMIAAPKSMLPLESLSSDQVLEIVELAGRDFGTVFVDLPTNWTNWSLSLLARSDVVLLITELSVASLHRARRQLDLLGEQQLGDLEVRVIVNRYERGLLKGAKSSAVRDALGREPAFEIANDFALMRAAIDRGVPLDEIKRKSGIARDLDAVDLGVAALLGLER